MSQKVIRGKRLMLFIKDAEGAYKSVALSTSHTLSLTASTVDLAVKTKDDADGKSWAEADIDVQSWTISSESLVSTSGYTSGHNFDDIFDLYLAGKPIEVVFDGIATSGVDQDKYKDGYTPEATADQFQGYKGQALITSLSINAPMDDNASYSIELTGNGPISKYTA